MDKEYFLLYINELGLDYKGQKQYEFIFSDDISVIDDSWYIVPSSTRANPPDIEYIKKIGLLKNSDIVLDLIQHSDYFGVIDSVEGIIALGWENYDSSSNELYLRLSFFYGEEMSTIISKLNKKGISLIFEDINNE